MLRKRVADGTIPRPTHDRQPCLNPVRSAAKKRSSPRGASGSAIDHQLDRIDVRRVVGGKEKHRFGKFFRLPPAAQWNSRRDEISELGGLFFSDAGAGSTLPDG